MFGGWLAVKEAASALSVWEDVRNYFSDPALWFGNLMVVIKIIAVILIGRLLKGVAQKTLNHIMMEREGSRIKFDTRRTKTVGKLLNNVVTYTINFIIIMVVLNQLGIDIRPVLAGAGVLGLAIGFGAQSLVKDVITGFFIIFEDQFGVGDTIMIGQMKGTVEEIGLRVTRIRSWSGEVHIIPNGSIQQVTNYSIYNSMAVADMSIAYEEDVDQAIKVLKETVETCHQDIEDLVKAPEVLGIQMMGASDIIIRVIAECKPNTHFGVERELKKRLKMALDQHGIEIPYPRVVSILKKSEGGMDHGEKGLSVR